MILLCVFLSPLLWSCATATDVPSTPPIKLPESFSRSGESPLEPRWWKSLDDPELDRLVKKALEGNFGLKAAWDRLKQARATVRVQGAGLYPQVNATGGAKRTARESNRTGRTYADEFSSGLTASYEIDLWGRVHSLRNAAVLRRRATRRDYRAAAITLSAQVAETWYSLVEQRGQRELLERQIDTNERYLKLIEMRFEKGEVPATDVLQQRKLVESTRTERTRVVARIKNLRHRLAVLLGLVPGRAELPGGDDLPGIPPLPATGVPAKWIRKRPDIRSAYLRLRAKNEDVAVAIAERYPQLDLKASLSSAAAEPALLFEEWIADVAATMAVPLVDGDRLDARVDRRRAAVSESLNKYGKTVLDAVREVEDALNEEKQQQETIQSIRRQLRLSRQAMNQLLREYRNGTQGFLRVLDELKTLQSLQRRLIEARKNLLIDRINLYRALGTGFKTREL